MVWSKAFLSKCKLQKWNFVTKPPHGGQNFWVLLWQGYHTGCHREMQQLQKMIPGEWRCRQRETRRQHHQKMTGCRLEIRQKNKRDGRIWEWRQMKLLGARIRMDRREHPDRIRNYLMQIILKINMKSYRLSHLVSFHWHRNKTDNGSENYDIESIEICRGGGERTFLE